MHPRSVCFISPGCPPGQKGSGSLLPWARAVIWKSSSHFGKYLMSLLWMALKFPGPSLGLSSKGTLARRREYFHTGVSWQLQPQGGLGLLSGPWPWPQLPWLFPRFSSDSLCPLPLLSASCSFVISDQNSLPLSFLFSFWKFHQKFFFIIKN